MFQSDIQPAGRHWSNWFRRPREPKEPNEVLASYRRLKRSKFKLLLGLVGLMLFCFIYGFFFSLLVPSAFAFLMSPLAVLLLLVIWALPEANWAPTQTLEWLFYASFIVLIVWPNYLAIALPGLPWITLIRLTAFPLVLILLSCISMSHDFRSALCTSLKGIAAVPVLLGIFVFVQFYSIALSHDVSASIQKFIVAQTTWTAMFFAAAYVFQKPGQIKRWSYLLWAMAVFVSLIAMWEYRLGRLPWVGHIPSFLKVDDDAVQAILEPHMRAYTDRYRAEATFSTPLGLAEYLALTLPFILHFSTSRFPRRTRIAALISLPVVLYGDFLTNAKLGMIGAVAGSGFYIFTVAFNNWQRNKGSLIAGSALWFLPVGVGLFGGLMLASHRFQVLIFGNDGSHAASTDTRVEQYRVGFQKFLQWPFGYGIGQGAATIHPGETGRITIDTYYLSVLLEYGIVGLIVYYGMFLIAIYEGVRRALFAPSNDENSSFLLPITASLVVFIIVKSVFSQQDNHPIVFMMLGALVALVSSYRRTAMTQAARSANMEIAYGAPARSS
jgi:hypothetical protein